MKKQYCQRKQLTNKTKIKIQKMKRNLKMKHKKIWNSEMEKRKES